jgi:hypothetical protein
MSNKALNWARKLPLKAGEKSVLKSLADSYNDKKGCCYPTMKKIGEWCGLTECTVKRHIKSLVNKNLIQKSDVRNQFGHRVTSKYTIIFDYNLNTLGIILSCGQLGSLSIILHALSIILHTPKYQNKTKDYILNQNIKPKENKDFSLGDDFNEQKTDIIIGVKFDQLRKVNDDHFDIKNAKKLFFTVCLKNKHPVRYAESLLKIRCCQIQEYEKQTKRGKLMPTPCSLKNWLEGERWNDIIKPLGDKKKVSPYVKCKHCGEEYLKGTYCKICARKSEVRLAYA